MRPVVFLDFDDVICINSVYGGYDVFSPNPPADLWQKLFHPPAVAVLTTVMKEYQPAVVITTSWLRWLDRQGIEQVLRRTQLNSVADSLHDDFEAPTLRNGTRLDAIQKWLVKHSQSTHFVVLDDEQSGTGLQDSRLDAASRVVWCKLNVGLEQRHLPRIGAALSQ